MFLPHVSFTGMPRRSLLHFAGLAISAPAWSFASASLSTGASAGGVSEKSQPPDGFPTQPPDLVR